jgi:hypothetical protein
MGLFPLWSKVRVLWLLIWWPLKAYMVVNFRARRISRGVRKLARTPALIKKKGSRLVISNEKKKRRNNHKERILWINYRIWTQRNREKTKVKSRQERAHKLFIDELVRININKYQSNPGKLLQITKNLSRQKSFQSKCIYIWYRFSLVIIVF